MNPRYQVFVSSTFRDLKDERQAVLNAIIELGHFPAGMEAFPAASATPWDLIKKIIGESDYYVLIVGGRYGSVDENGVSYTEREYDLAQELQIPTLVFPHADPMQLPGTKLEMDAAARANLEAFRAKVSKPHHLKSWKSPEDLQAKVVLGLNHEMRVNPRIGWIRGDNRDSPETLKKLTVALELNARLTGELDQLRKERDGQKNLAEERFAHGDEEVIVSYVVSSLDTNGGSHKFKTTWRELFIYFAGLIIVAWPQDTLILKFIRYMHSLGDSVPVSFKDGLNSGTRVAKEDWNRIVLQFLALGYWEQVPCKKLTPDSNPFMYGNEIEQPAYKLASLGVVRFAELKAMTRQAE